VIGFWTENGETEVLAALNRLDATRLNEVMIIFTRFVKSVGGNSISYFGIFLMLQKPMVNLESLRAKKTCRNSHVNSIRALFTNNGFECHIRLLPGDASWEKVLRRS
jgi:hypothetical protein